METHWIIETEKNYIENIFRLKNEIYDLKHVQDVRKIYKQLIQIKGVGNWTIDMFLISQKIISIFFQKEI